MFNIEGSTMRRFTLGLLLIFFLPSVCSAQSGRFVFWNMQSNWADNNPESDPTFLAEQMADKGTVDFWGLSEVLDQATLETFESAIEDATAKEYNAFLSNEGGRDRLAIIYNTDKFTQVGEPFEISTLVNQRPAFAIQLEGKTTGQRFYVLVVHFKCCGGSSNINKRVGQARALNTFANSVPLPVIAGGDFNTPYRVDGTLVPRAFSELAVSGPYEWIEPEILVSTEDSHRNILDYVFVANKIDGWSAASRILRRSGNIVAQPGDPFSDDSQNTDHRPVEAVFSLSAGDRIDEIEEEIATLERVLERLRAELQRLEDN